MNALATTDLPLTVHSRARLQQRAIPPLVVDLLMQFGSASRANGAERPGGPTLRFPLRQHAEPHPNRCA
ncbi:hypothetical protein ACVWXO_003543 [Bradyrhizobium sp. LM2.7]